MPDGKKHLAITVAGGIPVSLIAFGMNPDLAIPAIAGYFIGGLFVDPDLDHSARTASEKRIYDLNKPLGRLYSFLWTPYMKMTHHWGISHTPILGTLSRLLYLIAAMIPPAIIASIIVGIGINDWRIVLGKAMGYWGVLAVAFLAWCIADCLHIIADWIWNGKKVIRGGYGRH